MTTTSLTEFYNRLERHDWHFTYSDDGQVYRRGADELARLRVIAQESAAHQTLFDDFTRHIYSGPTWGTEPVAKPDRPS